MLHLVVTLCITLHSALTLSSSAVTYWRQAGSSFAAQSMPLSSSLAAGLFNKKVFWVMGSV
jgi:hypothetical protein